LAVTYSICSEKHLVLKKTLDYSAGRSAADLPAQWTLTFDSAKFNRRAPQWLIDVQNPPSLKIRKEWIGQAAPDFALPDLNGTRVKLSSLRGKIILLDFWSITCAPCIHEMPMVEAIGESYKTKDVVLLGISFDQSDKSKKWLLQHQHSLPTLTDTYFAVSDLYTVQGIPSLVLVGRDGKIKNYWIGEVPQTDLEAAIRRALKP
jgi:peroxiredoxin